MKRFFIPLLVPFVIGCTETTLTSTTCTADNQCSFPRVCRTGTCVVQCFLDNECMDGERCQFNRCESPVVVLDSGPDGAMSTDASTADMGNGRDAETTHDGGTPSMDGATTEPDSGLAPRQDATAAVDASEMRDSSPEIDSTRDAAIVPDAAVTSKVDMAVVGDAAAPPADSSSPMDPDGAQGGDAVAADQGT